ncbi:MAG: hypothetical protein WD095_00105 [Candidatus Paceibacterota bacterium]
MEKFPKIPDNTPENEKKREEERLGVAFRAASEGDIKFAKELGINFIEGEEEKRIEELFGESLDQQDSNLSDKPEQEEVFQRTGGESELYYELLSKNYPDLGISIKDLVDKSGNVVEDFYVLSIKINDKNREILEKLRDDKILELLRKEDFDASDFSEVLESKFLSEETAQRLLVRNYLKDPVRYENELNNIDKNPLSDEELKDIISERVEKILTEK